MNAKRTLLGISAAALLALGAPALSYADDDDGYRRYSYKEVHRHYHQHWNRGHGGRHGHGWKHHGYPGEHWNQHRFYDRGYQRGYRHGYRRGSHPRPWKDDDLTIIYRGHF